MSTMKKLSDVAPHKTKKKPRADSAEHDDKTHHKTQTKNRLGLSSRRNKIIAICAVGLLLAIGIILFFLFKLNNNKLAVNGFSKNAATPTIYYSPLTGREVSNSADTKLPVLAVMIENSPEARPQSGLKDAGVVFEAVAEGGITRFIALYQESEPALLGPVRSIRPYYLDWAAAFDPAIAHVGGSPEALNMIKTGSYGVDLDQSSNSSAYWRTKDRYSPHNVYTDYSHLRDLAESKGKSESNFTGFVREDVENATVANDDNADEATTSTKESATSINFAVSTGQFAVSYTYDSDSKTYKRFQGNVAHEDRENGQIAPEVVIAIRVNQSLQPDGVHTAIGSTGSGDCYIFQDGTVTAGTWSKSSSTDQIKFSDQTTGETIKLKRGQTWITAVGEGKDISWQ